MNDINGFRYELQPTELAINSEGEIIMIPPFLFVIKAILVQINGGIFWFI